jgi:hypothetical protein
LQKRGILAPEEDRRLVRVFSVLHEVLYQNVIEAINVVDPLGTTANLPECTIEAFRVFADP